MPSHTKRIVADAIDYLIGESDRVLENGFEIVIYRERNGVWQIRLKDGDQTRRYTLRLVEHTY